MQYNLDCKDKVMLYNGAYLFQVKDDKQFQDLHYRKQGGEVNSNPGQTGREIRDNQLEGISKYRAEEMQILTYQARVWAQIRSSTFLAMSNSGTPRVWMHMVPITLQQF